MYHRGVMPSDVSPSLPTVDVVTVNYNGKHHLGPCLASLAALDYPKDRYRVVCIDNASADGSAAYVRAAFPDVVLLEAGANLGFGGGCNLGARRSDADYVAFVNNDARADPGWLRALVGAVTTADPGIVCASALILDWEGRHVDFAGGHLNFHGFARQPDWRAPFEPGRHGRPGPILFPCGGAMIVRRDVFLDAGGFDEDYFMFFEDVDLGWRLWLYGYQVAYAPAAVTYHRHHASAGKLPGGRRTFLYERNALATILKNYDQANLDRVLPAALLLAAHRAGDLLQRAAGDLQHAAGGPGDPAPLVAMRDIAQRMPDLLAKRRTVQARRARPDAEILPLFGQPFHAYPMSHADVQPYCEDQSRLIRAFGIDAIFRQVKAHVLVLTNAGLPSLGFPGTPEGRRAEALGRGLEALGHPVRYSVPQALVDRHPGPLPPGIARLAWTDRTVDARLLGDGPDVIVATHWRPLAFARQAIYRPVVLDHNPAEPDLAGELDRTREIILRRDYLANVDLFICAGEAEREVLRAWLVRVASLDGGAGLDVAADRLRVVPAVVLDDGSVAGIEPLGDYCQNAWVGAAKRPVSQAPEPPRTPLLRLPGRAWASLRRRGPAQLWYDVREYLTWRIRLLRQSLGV